jgi:hypothetical protein
MSACSIVACSAAPRTRCRLSVSCAFGALSKPRDWAASPHFSPLARITRAPSHRAPSPPRFSAGEKVAEGRMRGLPPQKARGEKALVAGFRAREARAGNAVGCLFNALARPRDWAASPHSSPLARVTGAPSHRCRQLRESEIAVDCGFAAQARPRDWASDNAPKAQSTDNRQRAAGGRQAAGGAIQ